MSTPNHLSTRDMIIVGAVSPASGTLKIDPVKCLKVLSAFASLCLGPKGVPGFLSNVGDIASIVSRELPIAKKVESQGFALFSAALTAAIVALIKEHAPSVLLHPESESSIASVVLSSLKKEPIQVSARFLHTPGLNPAFIRVKESVSTLLARPALGVMENASNLITSRIGSYFVEYLHLTTQAAQSDGTFNEFLSALADNPFHTAASRVWQWDDYRADLNKQVYRRLFLHELSGHPDVSLPDVYIPSRAIYRDNQEIVDGVSSDHHNILHCVDVATSLQENWLKKTVKVSGHTRLLTGDPGTGKSTFSLLFAKTLSDDGWRVLFIPANSIRSLGLSFSKIIETHLQRTLKLDNQPNVDNELIDPDSTGRPLLIILDGLDEYDVGAGTVSLSAARLVDHVMTVMDEWVHHGHSVRLLLCGRPEAASSLTRFRELGHHLHITGFVSEKSSNDQFADQASKEMLDVDQREEWWRRWQEISGEEIKGLPDVIRSGGEGVREITAQPLLNYMLAVLKLYTPEYLTNLSALYGALFSRYYERQREGKSGTFDKICPSLERFRRVMSEIGLAAWHAGDRSVSVEDLQTRFNKPPLKSWFDKAGPGNSGLGAILSAFYTRPEDSADPDSGLAQRYVFTHKSFREYLTGVGIVRFLRKLAEQLEPDAEDGWSDEQSLSEWLRVFGPTALDQRQWQFLLTELQTSLSTEFGAFQSVKRAVERIFELCVRGKMPVPEAARDLRDVIEQVGNAEEAVIGVLSAIRRASPSSVPREELINVDWPRQVDGDSNSGGTALTEMIHRMRSRPGSPDGFLSAHIGCLFEVGGGALNEQLASEIRRRADGWEYARIFDFTGFDISGSDLSNADLYFSRFHRTTVGGANFFNVNLDQADMSHLDDESLFGPVRITSFVNVKGRNSRWLYARQSNVDFDGATLQGADLRSSKIDYSDAILDQAVQGSLAADNELIDDNDDVESDFDSPSDEESTILS